MYPTSAGTIFFHIMFLFDTITDSDQYVVKNTHACGEKYTLLMKILGDTSIQQEKPDLQ
jgi:hypothetical protein